MAVVHRKRLSTSLSNEHFQFLNSVCEENKQTQSAVIEIALDILKDQLKNKNLYEIIKDNSSK